MKAVWDLEGFEGDLYLVVKMLLPGVDQRVYNLKEKQIIKHFSQVWISVIPAVWKTVMDCRFWEQMRMK